MYAGKIQNVQGYIFVEWRIACCPASGSFQVESTEKKHYLDKFSVESWKILSEATAKDVTNTIQMYKLYFR